MIHVFLKPEKKLTKGINFLLGKTGTTLVRKGGGKWVPHPTQLSKAGSIKGRNSKGLQLFPRIYKKETI